MQQTDKYKLNLIETSDTFSPAPLNENMEKLETAVCTETAALGQRLTVLERPRVAVGTYTGNGQEPRKIELPFTPKFILIFSRKSNEVTDVFTIFENTVPDRNRISGYVVPGGFELLHVNSTKQGLNVPNITYDFVALT